MGLLNNENKIDEDSDEDKINISDLIDQENMRL